MELKIYTNIADCQKLWELCWPEKGLFDLWQVRACFHNEFQRPLYFQTVESKGEILGFLPLCWCEESCQYVFFPGETWQGKTWLEQNKVFAKDKKILQMLLKGVPGSFHLRYLAPAPLLKSLENLVEDEKGYLFYPGIFDHAFENYWLGFSGKSRKKLKRDMEIFDAFGVKFQFNELEDLDHLFRLNTASFFSASYFHDPRFHGAFTRLARFLRNMGWLRMTTICIGKEVAAVDMGAVFNNTYTLLAGGTDPRFKGVAKLINLHHMEWACQKRMDSVDFLCGNFNWKDRFHLTPRPLFQLSDKQTHNLSTGDEIHAESICA